MNASTRRHYRVAKKEIYEDPYEGIYVTKEEAQKYMLLTLGLIGISFIVSIISGLKKRF